MTPTKFISTDKLTEYIDGEVRSLLISRGLYDINNYGWLNDHDPDPDHFGHAMRQMYPRVEPEWNHIFNQGPITYRPTPIDTELMINGSDFEGLMKVGRLSSGLMLLYEQQVLANRFDDHTYFWLHHLSAVLMLSTASDRLRDFFVVTISNEPAEGYRRQHPRASYAKPFEQAMMILGLVQEQQDIGNLIDRLNPLASDISNYRNDRNEIVHRISTKLGKREKELLEKQQTRFDEQQQPGYQPTSLSHTWAPGDDFKRSDESEVDKTINQPLNFYKCLVEASSLVFEIEHALRKCRASQ